ncbi:MAG: hypothetical protein DMG37_19380 [Acidobacteria bacterium]|nr:MAG: hypothetical protein DMG37_19380 [Acidobacteriota bacterium]
MHRRVLTLLCVTFALCAATFVLSSRALAQEHTDHAAAAKAKPTATLMTGYGNWHHPVSTKNAQAQAFFDQGLRQIYAFNHDEAARSFQRAGELDPKLAMAFWGVAEAVGPNYNDPASDDRFVKAHEAIAKAQSLAAEASESDKAYIDALAKRFPADTSADRRAALEQYRDAMREVMKRFPDDLDAATLSAEAGMNLHPWGLWRPDGTPAEGTEEIVATLESVIRREPNHLGAIHYYIHSVEASNSPERALAGANRLAELAPSAGHIVHMPAHIYIRTGDYEAALKTNQKAALADQAYIKGGAAPGIYSMMYYSHNLHFIAMAAAMNGNYAEARKTPQPDAALQTANFFWHFARGLALAGTGDLDGAEAEHKIVTAAEEKTSPDAVFQMPINNKTKDILKIAENVLGAKISLAKNDMDATVNQLRTAVEVQEGLKYDEPEDWFYPVRENLGAVLLKIGDYAGAEEAFRADLAIHPRNPRSLFGLEQALKSQEKAYDADFVRKQFDANWKGAARPTVDDLV